MRLDERPGIALCVEEDRLGGHEAGNDDEVAAGRRPGDIVHGALLQAGEALVVAVHRLPRSDRHGLKTVRDHHDEDLKHDQVLVRVAMSSRS